MEPAKLHVIDWLVFALTMIISLGIGIYYSMAGGRQRTTSEYLMGDRKMSLIPVTMSFMVSFISTLTLLGYPAEMYAFGGQYWLGGIGNCIGCFLAAVVFVPVFYPLKMVSVNEYHVLRYNSRTVKILGSIYLILGAIFYTANVYFGPSTAIEAVSGFPTWASILIASVISVLYTTIGGIKAVIWTDVFQCLIMFAGMLAVLIVGLNSIGFGTAFEIANKWGRLDIFQMNPNPLMRLNFYGIVFASALHFIGVNGYLQAGVQRYSSLPTLSDAKKCVMGSAPGMFLLVTISCLCGIVVFAYYMSIGCDPIKAGVISSANQVLPYFVVDVFKIPALSGLFIASLSSASLSSASSSLNASAANLWQDVLQDYFPDIQESRKALIIKISVCVLGIMATLMAFAITTIGGTVLQIIMTFSAAFHGPAAALFYMGLFLPWVNWKGAAVGTIISVAFGLWVSFGAYSLGTHWETLPTTDANCTDFEDMWNSTATTMVGNFSSLITQATTATQPEVSGIDLLYSLSFIWFRDVVAVVAIIIALIVSFFTGFTDLSKIDLRTLHPLTIKLLGLKRDEPEDKEEIRELRVLSVDEINEVGIKAEMEPLKK